MSKGYSGALCGSCIEWFREVHLCPRRRFYVCSFCLVIEPVIATLPDKVEGA